MTLFATLYVYNNILNKSDVDYMRLRVVVFVWQDSEGHGSECDGCISLLVPAGAGCYNSRLHPHRATTQGGHHCSHTVSIVQLHVRWVSYSLHTHCEYCTITCTVSIVLIAHTLWVLYNYMYCEYVTHCTHTVTIVQWYMWGNTAASAVEPPW